MKNPNLVQRDKKHVWHPFTQIETAPDPLPIVSAEGVWLTDENGKKYLDLNSSWWTIIHGHCHPYIAEKISEQFSTLDHIIFAGATHPSAVEAAERICEVLGDGFDKVFFSDNGSTSVEVAIKMIYQRWYNEGVEKKRFLAIEGAYHGDTFGAMSVGQRGYFNKPFEHLFFDVDYIPFPTEENYESVIAKAEAFFESGTFAGFIFEPLVQGAAGMRMYKAEWLDQLVGLARKHNVMTIADEVMTGFYRTGKMFAIDHLENRPDIICMSKGLTGGVLPLGLTVTSDEVFDVFRDEATEKALLHGHSFTGNPISCAAVRASMDLLQRDETKAQIKMICESHTRFMNDHKDHPGFRRITRQGTILTIQLEAGEGGSYFSDIRNQAYNYFLDNGFLIRPLGNTVFVNPPYCISPEELHSGYDIILSFAEKLTNRF